MCFQRTDQENKADNSPSQEVVAQTSSAESARGHSVTVGEPEDSICGEGGGMQGMSGAVFPDSGNE